ncbi:MAG: APC family permease [Saprospiraceae bacterium]|nr:APC family permease [Saprospiraceae bacterium]
MSSTSQKLNIFSMTMIVVGIVIGLGIFRTATDAAKASINSQVFFIAWILGGLVALCGALTYAEIGSRYPVMGGYYKIFSFAYHPAIAFALNCVILFANAAALSGVAIIGSEYLLNVIYGLNYPLYYNSILGIVAIITFFLLNLKGLILSSRALNILMIVKIGMLVMIILAIFTDIRADPSEVMVLKSTPSGFLGSLAAALVAVCFTYGGYQQSINFGDEVVNPERTVPRGIIIGIAIVILIYLSVNYSYLQLIGFEQLKSAKGVGSIIAEKLFGETGKQVFSILMFVAILAFINVMMMANPRIMYAMADDKVLPNIFKKKIGKNQVLVINLSVFALLSIITLIFASQFEKILGFVMFLDSVGMVASATTLFIMRKQNVGEERPGFYKMKFYPYVTIFFILSYILVCGSIIVNFPTLALTGTLVFLGFLILYFIIKRFEMRTES